MNRTRKRNAVALTKRIQSCACSMFVGGWVLLGFGPTLLSGDVYAESPQRQIAAPGAPINSSATTQATLRDPRITRFTELSEWQPQADDIPQQPSTPHPLQKRTATPRFGNPAISPEPSAQPTQRPSAQPTQRPSAQMHKTLPTVLQSNGNVETDQPIKPNYWWKPLIKNQQRATPQQRAVTLNGLLVSALSNSARIQVLADEPLITETEITTADSNFDWYSFLEARWDDLDEPVGSTLTTGGPDRFRDHNVNVTAGLRRRNPLGGEVEISQRFGHQNNNSVFFVPNNQGTSRLTFSYTQPLLRGAGRVYNTSFTVIAKLNTNIANDEFNRQLQDHLLDITQSYWNLYFERGKLLQQEKLLESGLSILEELESREGVDALQSQIVRARAAVENRRAQLVRARLAIRIAEARVRALVNDPDLGDTLTMELVPSEDLSESPMDVDLRDSISEAMKNRPEITAAMTQIKAASVRMNLSKNETLPLLNLVLDSYLAGLEGNSRVFGAFNDQFNEGVPSYGVGLQYEYPFWNRAAQSRLQKRRLELRRLQHQFRQTMETLKLEVEVAVHELNAAYESLEAKRRAMDAANEEVDYLKDRWELLPVDNGSASLLLEDLLDAQDRLTDSEQSLLQSTLEYGLAQVTYKRAIGSLLQHHDIDLNRSCECKLPAQRPTQSTLPKDHHALQWSEPIGGQVAVPPVSPETSLHDSGPSVIVPPSITSQSNSITSPRDTDMFGSSLPRARKVEIARPVGEQKPNTATSSDKKASTAPAPRVDFRLKRLPSDEMPSVEPSSALPNKQPSPNDKFEEPMPVAKKVKVQRESVRSARFRANKASK